MSSRVVISGRLSIRYKELKIFGIFARSLKGRSRRFDNWLMGGELIEEANIEGFSIKCKVSSKRCRLTYLNEDIDAFFTSICVEDIPYFLYCP